MSTKTPRTVSNRTVTEIAPERLYPLAGFERVSGIGRTKRREASLAGVRLRTIAVGRRKFVRGADAIAFIEAIAASPALSPSA